MSLNEHSLSLPRAIVGPSIGKADRSHRSWGLSTSMGLTERVAGDLPGAAEAGEGSCGGLSTCGHEAHAGGSW